MITICYDDTEISDCNCIVLVPDIAISEPGYIKTFTTSAESVAKHEFQALAQMAYYQYQDDELHVTRMESGCKVSWCDELEKIDSGVVIFRTENGELKALAHESVNCKKLLEAANRYCTRWVRLDI